MESYKGRDRVTVVTRIPSNLGNSGNSGNLYRSYRVTRVTGNSRPLQPVGDRSTLRPTNSELVGLTALTLGVLE